MALLVRNAACAERVVGGAHRDYAISTLNRALSFRNRSEANIPLLLKGIVSLSSSLGDWYMATGVS